MYKELKVSVVVPALNEEDLIREMLLSIPGFVDKIYVVDDGSIDRTGKIVQDRCHEDGRINLIIHERNMGVGAAIVHGYRASLDANMDLVVVMAGDNQMDPNAMPSLLDPLAERTADYSKGNRLHGQEYRKGMSRWRFLGNSLLTFLTRISSGYWDLADPQNGYTAISRKALKSIDLDSVYPGYGYCNDLLAKLNVEGFRVVDAVIPARYGKEKSKIKYRRYIPRVSNLLLKNFFWRLNTKYMRKGFRPLVLLYILGILLVAVGLAAEMHTLYSGYILGGNTSAESIFLFFVIVLIGMHSLLFAMYFDKQDDRRLRKP